MLVLGLMTCPSGMVYVDHVLYVLVRWRTLVTVQNKSRSMKIGFTSLTIPNLGQEWILDGSSVCMGYHIQSSFSLIPKCNFTCNDFRNPGITRSPRTPLARLETRPAPSLVVLGSNGQKSTSIIQTPQYVRLRELGLEQYQVLALSECQAKEAIPACLNT
jgi:hypothetical protein